MRWLSIKHGKLHTKQNGDGWEAETVGVEANEMFLNNDWAAQLNIWLPMFDAKRRSLLLSFRFFENNVLL